MEVFDWSVIFGGGGLIAMLTLAYTVFRNYRVAKEQRVKAIENVTAELKNHIIELREADKRVHYRVDSVEMNQNRLESKIDNDIQEVKLAIDKLTDIVLKAIQK